MTARLDEITGLAPKLDKTPTIKTNPFIDSPAEFLVKKITIALRDEPVFVSIFGAFIEPYMRMDYPVRAFPAVRIFEEGYTKEFDSWFINGDITLDVIMPANLRRFELQELPDTLSSALLQQFRRPTFFKNMCEEVPGLNELGKRFTVDKSLAFNWQGNECPLTRITLNFRIDLREWDAYLEETNRTKDEPFSKTLGDLKRIAGIIEGVRNNSDETIQTGTDQIVTGD